MKHITDGGRLARIIAPLLCALALGACPRYVTPDDADALANAGISAGEKCVLTPAYNCIWGASGWRDYAACLERHALPCLGEHLIALAPVAVSIGHNAGLFLAGVDVPPNPYLAQAQDCIAHIPEPLPGQCGDDGLDQCGARRVAACVDAAAMAAERAGSETVD